MEILVVGLGGFFGAIARYLVYLFERSMGVHSFPFGTLLINVFGCLLAGLFLGAIERTLPINRHLILLGSMGLVGSFTTFSTFSVETFQLIRANDVASAMFSIGANVILGIGAVWIGWTLILKL